MPESSKTHDLLRPVGGCRQGIWSVSTQGDLIASDGSGHRSLRAPEYLFFLLPLWLFMARLLIIDPHAAISRIRQRLLFCPFSDVLTLPAAVHYSIPRQPPARLLSPLPCHRRNVCRAHERSANAVSTMIDMVVFEEIIRLPTGCRSRPSLLNFQCHVICQNKTPDMKHLANASR